MKCPDCGSFEVMPVEGNRRMTCRRCRLVWWLPPPRLTEVQQEAGRMAILRKAIADMDDKPQHPIYVTPSQPIQPVYDDKGKLIV